MKGVPMNAPLDTNDTQSSDRTGAILLIALGSFFLLARFLNLGWLALPALSAGLLLTGVLRREAGWFIPGGILAGISLGIFLIEGPLSMVVGDESRGGVFLLALALGWLSILILSKLFTDEPQWWPLIPGTIMALIGGVVLVGNPGRQALVAFGYVWETFAYIWPMGLIAAGLYFIVRHRQVTQ
jgi:hypothetical protein